MMTLSQARGMLRFHKAAYRAYKQAGKVTGNYTNANMAHDKMIQAYLLVRALRSANAK